MSPAGIVFACVFGAALIGMLLSKAGAPLVAFDLLDVAVAGLIGVSALALLGLLSGRDVAPIIDQGGPTLALLFGGMVVARTLVPTGVFDRVSDEQERRARQDDELVLRDAPGRHVGGELADRGRRGEG
jgi:Na+/H+ antiporter NhaD/arsenite permease-like protein